MKKIFATILAVLYLATSTGATITLHYCMGKLASVDMMKKDTCDKCGMKKAKGCCEDKIKVIKVQDSHQFVQHMFAVQLQEVLLQKNYYTAAAALQSFQPVAPTNNNSPPGIFNNPLYILHRVFRL